MLTFTHTQKNSNFQLSRMKYKKGSSIEKGVLLKSVPGLRFDEAVIILLKSQPIHNTNIIMD